jgi:hypothetical protein
MNSPASRARENAISFEAKKDGLQQRQNGDWVLRLTVQAIDMHQIIVTAKMGTRFAVSMVEINDDETPVDHKAMERDKWRALGATKQAGIRCKDPIFWAYLFEDGRAFKPVIGEKAAAEIVRDLCNVLTRSDLDKPGFADARILWFDLDKNYQAWKARENA